MTKIIIFEGISTCGKTTVKELVYEQLINEWKSCLKVDEGIISKTFLSDCTEIEESKIRLKDIFLSYLSKKYDYILFDRCHFSNIMIFKCAFEEFTDVEKLLVKHKAKIIWLYFHPKHAVQRIRNSLQYRKGIGFERYISRLIKGTKNVKEESAKIYAAYKKDIDNIDGCFKKTKLKYLKVDVSKIVNKDNYLLVLPSIMKYIKQ